MKRLKRFLRPPTALAEQQALSWISKMTGSDLSLKQEAEFAVWLSLDSLHHQLFDELISIWEMTGALSEPALLRITQVAENAQPSNTTNITATLAPISPQPEAQSTDQGWLATLRRFWQPSLGFPVIGTPAAFATVIAMFMVWASLTGEPAARLLETKTGGYAKIALEDGSVLHLNTNTQVRVRYTPNARQLQLLSGELFIEVAKDPQRPLTIHTEAFSATAIGTAFGVAATPTQRWVEVAHGEVLVRNSRRAEYLARGDGSNGSQHALLAGEKLQLDEESSSLDLELADAEQIASWRGGQLFYRDIALRDLLEDLNRYHRQQLVVHDTALGDIHVSAVLNSNDHSGAVAALSSSLDLIAHEIGDTVTLLSFKTHGYQD